MEQRTFHGDITADDLARALIAEFDQGNMQAQNIGRGDRLIVQIASRAMRSGSGQTAVTVTLDKVEDGVLVQLGDQQWLGVAASLGTAAFAALQNPFSLLGRLDELAQDVSSLQLSASIWSAIQRAVDAAGASHQISERLRRIECAFCGAAVPVGEANCPACGAPMGVAQPKGCPHCGFVVPAGVTVCPKCQTVV